MVTTRKVSISKHDKQAGMRERKPAPVRNIFSVLALFFCGVLTLRGDRRCHLFHRWPGVFRFLRSLDVYEHLGAVSTIESGKVVIWYYSLFTASILLNKIVPAVQFKYEHFKTGIRDAFKFGNTLLQKVKPKQLLEVLKNQNTALYICTISAQAHRTCNERFCLFVKIQLVPTWFFVSLQIQNTIYFHCHKITDCFHCPKITT